jgi:hypothetical protein
MLPDGKYYFRFLVNEKESIVSQFHGTSKRGMLSSLENYIDVSEADAIQKRRPLLTELLTLGNSYLAPLLTHYRRRPFPRPEFPLRIACVSFFCFFRHAQSFFFDSYYVLFHLQASGLPVRMPSGSAHAPSNTSTMNMRRVLS